LLQNISKHGYSNNEFKEGIFSLFKKGDNYGISAGNYIKNREKEEFEKLLLRINNLNKDKLKDLYLHQVKYGDETEGGGAGIGLIDIARLLSEKIEYSFIEKENNTSFFTINVII